MARFLVLPGSKWQLALVKKLKEKGHWVCVVSPEEDPPCADPADAFFRSDIFAINDIVKQSLDYKIDAVLSDECDIAMPVIAELGDRLGVKTLSREAAALYTDKYLMREYSKRQGIKSPEYKLCSTVDDAISFFDEIGKTIIIKPIDSNSSHGVFMVNTHEEIRQHFDEALAFSKAKKAVLAERYINGTEFTIDGIKTPKRHYSLAISEKKHFNHNPNIADELYFTHFNSKYDYKTLCAINDRFINNSPLEFGFTHAEYKCEGNEFYLIEIGARGGGNMISSVITEYMSGYDVYSFLIECAIGNITSPSFPIDESHENKAAVLKFFSTPDDGGIVTGIKGLDYLEQETDIKEHQLNFHLGDRIENADSDSARIGFYIACTDSRDALNSIIKKVDNSFSIELKDENDD